MTKVLRAAVATSVALATIALVPSAADAVLPGPSVEHDGTWQVGSDLPAPRGAAGEFPVEPVAAADRIALTGQGRVWVLTVSADAPRG